MQHLNRHRFRPQLEKLEGRALLSVTGFVDAAGNLFINGDPEANSIALTQSAPGTYDVTGDLTERFSGVTGDINLQMGGGGDFVTIHHMTAPKDLRVDMKSGIGMLDIESATIFGDVSLKGDASHIFNDCTILGDVRVRGSANGNGVSLVDTTLWGNAAFDLGAGADVVFLIGSRIVGELDFDYGAGEPFNTDQLIIQSSNVEGNVRFQSHKRRSNDLGELVVISDSRVGGATFIHTGSGTDFVQLSGVFTKQVNVHLGGGDDTLEFGPDGVTLLASSNIFHGGHGTDTLTGTENIEGSAKFISFP